MEVRREAAPQQGTQPRGEEGGRLEVGMIGRKARKSFLLVVGLVVSAAAVRAEGNAPAGSAALRGELIVSLSEAADKIASLAEAIPAERYAWRPAEKVRSVSEVVMHVAGGSLFFSRVLGFPSEVAARDFEKETDKAKILATFKSSVEHAKKALQQISDAELERQRDALGGMRSGRAIAIQMVSHTHEHLGQLIAYARSLGIAPPWSS
jgi:uncharacterized damage-inducible protein DinB